MEYLVDQRSHKNAEGSEFKPLSSGTTPKHPAQYHRVRKPDTTIHRLNITTTISHHSQIANASNYRGFFHVNRGTTRRSYKKKMCTTIAFGIHQLTDFVRYLVRRELVTTGLLQFSDQPESYRVWRRSFQREHDLTHSEDMDLLFT